MNCSVFSSSLTGTIKAPPSKSQGHRALICAALADRETVIDNLYFCEDLETTINCLSAFGAKIENIDNRHTLFPIKEYRDSVTINVQESGSTLRFLLPLLGALAHETVVLADSGLACRPISPIIRELKKKGVTFLDESFPLKIRGRATEGEYKIEGNVSSQFISGLLFYLPLLKKSSEIIITTPLESVGYIDMTIDCLNKFGVYVEKTEKGFFIKGDTKYKSPGNIFIEGDWSSAAFFLCLGAINGDVTIENLSPYSLQGDKQIAKILSDMGAKITFNNNSCRVVKNELIATKIDASNIPDLVPALAATALFAKGETVIYNAQRLKYKESNRLETTFKALKNIGGDIKIKDSSLIINGGKPLLGGVSSSYKDHRIAMCLTVASQNCKNPVIIENYECVNKSYPRFFRDFKALEGNFNVL